MNETGVRNRNFLVKPNDVEQLYP